MLRQQRRHHRRQPYDREDAQHGRDPPGRDFRPEHAEDENLTRQLLEMRGKDGGVVCEGLRQTPARRPPEDNRGPEPDGLVYGLGFLSPPKFTPSHHARVYKI